MRKSKRPNFKIQRRLMIELPGLGKSGALERRPYPPGQHGSKRRKFSGYSLQLQEKQKLMFHYGLREKQLRHLISRSKKAGQGDWTSKAIENLELRLSNILLRANFAISIAAASQLCSHGKVLVNSKRLDIKSAILKVGDRISLVPEAYENQVYLEAQKRKALELPDFLRMEGKEILISSLPTIESIPFPFDRNLFTEYYSVRS